MNYVVCLSKRTKNVLWCVLLFLVFVVALLCWYSPRKVEKMISLQQEPTIFFVINEGGYQDFDDELDAPLKEKLGELWCMRTLGNDFFLNSGDFLLLYDDFGVILTPNGGYIYSLRDKNRNGYQMLDQEKTRQIWSALNQKHLTFSGS